MKQGNDALMVMVRIMDNVLKIPITAIVDKIVPKSAFYKHLDVNARLKARFVEDIDRIVWLAKLASSTLNVEDGKAVHEITVFHALLKSADVPDDVFLAIDRQMPRHVLFLLQFEERYRLLLNYKEWIDESKGTFRIIKSFRTEWTDGDTLQLSINASNMDKLYEAFAGQISGFGTNNAADTKRIIDLQQQLAQKQRAVEALQKKVRAERQFNRQMQLNAEARALKKELAALQEEIDNMTTKNNN
jgi:hypothetical protein